MPLELKELASGKILEVQATGKLERDDYERFGPEVERLIARHGKVRVLLALHDFHGWKAGALWDDIKFNARHFNDIDRLAIIGESRWQQGMATFCKPFTTATIRYFNPEQALDARRWLQEDMTVGDTG